MKFEVGDNWCPFGIPPRGVKIEAEVLRATLGRPVVDYFRRLLVEGIGKNNPHKDPTRNPKFSTRDPARDPEFPTRDPTRDPKVTLK